MSYSPKIGDEYVLSDGAIATICVVAFDHCDVAFPGVSGLAWFSHDEIKGLIASGAWKSRKAIAVPDTGPPQCIGCGKPNEFQPGPYRCFECKAIRKMVAA